MTRLLTLLCATFILQACQEDRQKPYECKTNIASKICYQKTFDSDECYDNPDYKLKEKAAKQLRDILDYSPAYVQNKFCKLDRLIIVTDKKEDAWLSGRAGNNKIWLAADLFDNSRENDFYGITDNMLSYKQDKDGNALKVSKSVTDIKTITAHIEYPSRHKSFINFGLSRVLYHEIAHIIEEEDLVLAPFHCLPYHADTLPLEEKHNENYCSHHLPNNLSSDITKSLEASIYPSLYATCTKHEHFAEIFANHIIHKHFDIDFIIYKNHVPIYKQSNQYMQPQMRPYNKMVESILEMGYINDQEVDKAKLDHLTCSGVFDPKIVGK